MGYWTIEYTDADHRECEINPILNIFFEDDTVILYNGFHQYVLELEEFDSAIFTWVKDED